MARLAFGALALGLGNVRVGSGLALYGEESAPASVVHRHEDAPEAAGDMFDDDGKPLFKPQPNGRNVNPSHADFKARVGADGKWFTHWGTPYLSNGLAPRLDLERLQRDLGTSNVLFVGSSIDRNAAETFCNVAGQKFDKEVVPTQHPNHYKRGFCKAGNFSLAWVVIPGSGARPYWDDVNWDTDTETIIKQQAPLFTQTRFHGAAPSLIVVEDSLWVLSKWWQWQERPHQPFPVDDALMGRWCSRELRELFTWVETAYPTSKIAFRAPPLILRSEEGQSQLLVKTMQKCIMDNTVQNKLWSKYSVIPYDVLVSDALLEERAFTNFEVAVTRKDPAPHPLYMDARHPGPRLSAAYMNMVLERVPHAGGAPAAAED